jgi:hypothetical protein
MDVMRGVEATRNDVSASGEISLGINMLWVNRKVDGLRERKLASYLI